MQAFLKKSTNRVFFLKGDAGAGKTISCLYLERDLWKKFTKEGIIPLYIDLSTIDTSGGNLIKTHLHDHDLKESEIHYLLRSQQFQFVLICDNYNSRSKTCNIYTSNSSSSRNDKMVITCRNIFLPSDYKGQFLPLDYNYYHDTSDDFYEEATIGPLSESNIRNIIQQYIQCLVSPKPGNYFCSRPTPAKKDPLKLSTVDEYWDALSVVPGMLELAGSPLLLWLALRYLPTLSKPELNPADREKIKATKLLLFNYFTTTWAGYNKKRLHSAVLTEDEAQAFAVLRDVGFEDSVICFMIDLARDIVTERDKINDKKKHQDKDTWNAVEYNARRDKCSWKEKYFGHYDHETKLLREASLLTKVEKYYSFMYDTLFYYFRYLGWCEQSGYGPYKYDVDGGDDGNDDTSGNRGGSSKGGDGGLTDKSNDPTSKSGRSAGSNTQSGGDNYRPSDRNDSRTDNGSGSTDGSRSIAGVRSRIERREDGSDGDKDGEDDFDRDKNGKDDSDGDKDSEDDSDGDKGGSRHRKYIPRPARKGNIRRRSVMTPTEPFASENYLGALEALSFLVERTHSDPSLRTGLFSAINRAKSLSTPSLAAANAITTLYMAGERFQDVDMSGINIPGDYILEEAKEFLDHGLIAILERHQPERLNSTVPRESYNVIEVKPSGSELHVDASSLELQGPDNTMLKSSEGSSKSNIMTRLPPSIGLLKIRNFADTTSLLETLIVDQTKQTVNPAISGLPFASKPSKTSSQSQSKSINIKPPAAMATGIYRPEEAHNNRIGYIMEYLKENNANMIPKSASSNKQITLSPGFDKVQETQEESTFHIPDSRKPSSKPTFSSIQSIQNDGAQDTTNFNLLKKFSPFSPVVENVLVAHMDEVDTISLNPVKKYPIQSSLSLVLDKAQKTPDIEDDILALRSERMDEYIQPLYIAPLAKASLAASDDTLPLMDKIKDFISSDCRVLLIQGDSAIGKTVFIQRLEYELWQQYRSGSCIPLYINLSLMSRPHNELISERLMDCGFSELQIKELMNRRQFVLICDGYDESRLGCNLYITNNLARIDAKLIITCRPLYLGPDYHTQFAPPTSDSHGADSLLQECIISPFNKSQIKNYIEQFVSLQSRTWTVSKYIEILETLPGLMDLVKNPFLLNIYLNDCPMIMQDKSDLSKLYMARVQLYDIFVQRWLEVNERRLSGNTAMKDGDHEVYDLKRKGGFEQRVRSFQKNLATSIFQKQHGNPLVNYSQPSDKDTWKSRFFGPKSKNGLHLDASFVNRAGFQYQFIHRSMLEYFYSCAIWEPLNDNDLDLWSSIDDHPLSNLNLIPEPSIIQFLAGRVQQNSSFKYYLLGVIEQSKYDMTVSQAAANSITILVRAGVRFNGQHLRGIHISGADLSGGEFDSAQLQGADLRNVNFTKCWIRQADFSNAVMSGVRFGELASLKTGQPVCSCAYSPDGKFLAIGLMTGGVIIYETTSWTQAFAFDSHYAEVTSLAFSPSGNFLLSGSDDKTVRLWNCATTSAEFVLKGHTGSISTVAYSPNNKQVASASTDKTLRLWDAISGAALFSISNHAVKISGITYSPDGASIASADIGGTIRIFSTITARMELIVNQGAGSASRITYSPDGSAIIVGDTKGELWQLESRTGKLESQWKGHSGKISGISFSPNGKWIASSDIFGDLKLWDACLGKVISSFSGHSSYVSDIVFAPYGQQLASGGRDETVRLWDLSDIETGYPQMDDFLPVTSIITSLDGNSIVCGRSTGIVLYDATSGEIVRTIFPKSFQFDHLAMSPNGLQVAIAGKDIQVWDVETGQMRFALPSHNSVARAIAYSPCGKWIATGDRDANIHVWDAETGRPIRLLANHKQGVSDLQISSNGHQLVSIDCDGVICIWEMETGMLKKTLVGNDDDSVASIISYNRTVVFSPNGEQVAESCSDNHVIRIWTLSNNEPPYMLEHDGGVDDFAWSNCGEWIAAIRGRSVWLWKVESSKVTEMWKRTVVIRDFQRPITSIAWTSNSLHFVTGCMDGSVRSWKLVEDSDGWSAQLIWNSGHSTLAVSGNIFSDAVGLSEHNRKLLEQRSYQRWVSVS
ncbi:hypothetical protein FBU30_006780 [Linnemannia zychae]|nr:hypothetical protein FBU30_006780 [Linnemannia zychae]